MIEIQVGESIVVSAMAMAREMGAIRNSITKGQGNIAGFIGELVVLDLVGGKIEKANKDFDIVAPDGTTIDVKTKRTSVIPKPGYQCSIASTSLHQGCSSYAFVRVSNDMTTAWVCGIIDAPEFYAKAKLFKKGETEGDNNYVVKQDCYSMTIEEVIQNSNQIWTNLAK